MFHEIAHVQIALDRSWGTRTVTICGREVKFIPGQVVVIRHKTSVIRVARLARLRLSMR
jgi:hypothetical protein